MKVTWFTGVCLLALAAVVSLPWAPALAQTGDVYQVKFSLTGATQDDDGGDPSIVKVKASGNGMVNLALGRDADTALATNEVLALVVDCTNEELTLIVYDRNTSSNVATIATLLGMANVEDLKRGQFVASFEVQSLGDASNGLNDGYLDLIGTYTIGTNDCPTSISATVVGVVDITITDDVGTHSGDVLITKGKLSIGKAPIGTLP